MKFFVIVSFLSLGKSIKYVEHKKYIWKINLVWSQKKYFSILIVIYNAARDTLSLEEIAIYRWPLLLYWPPLIFKSVS